MTVTPNPDQLSGAGHNEWPKVPEVPDEQVEIVDAEAAFDMAGLPDPWETLDVLTASQQAKLRRAAYGGSPRGAVALARSLEGGVIGILEDKVEALRWYRVAAEKGNANALNMVGRFYTEGWGGLAKDNAEAVAWFRRAAEAGDASGANNLARIVDDGSGEGEVEALRWYRVAAEKGNANALNMVSLFYYEGLGGLAKDDAEAVAWTRRAAEAGDASGCESAQARDP